MSSYWSRCPDCGGHLEKRGFVDGETLEGKPDDVTLDWWCPICKLRWMSFHGEPLEVEG